MFFLKVRLVSGDIIVLDCTMRLFCVVMFGTFNDMSPRKKCGITGSTITGFPCFWNYVIWLVWGLRQASLLFLLFHFCMLFI